MKRSVKIALGVILGIGFLFLVREYWIARNANLQIFAEKHIALLRTSSGRMITFGDADSSQAQVLQRAVEPYFGGGGTLALEDLEIHNQIDGKDFSLQKLSPNVTKGIVENQTIWFLGKITEEEIGALQIQAVAFEGYIWILQGNDFFEFFETPEMIVFLGERKPTKKLTEFATTKKVPLVSVSETGGTMLEFTDEQWEIRTRK